MRRHKKLVCFFVVLISVFCSFGKQNVYAKNSFIELRGSNLAWNTLRSTRINKSFLTVTDNGYMRFQAGVKDYGMVAIYYDNNFKITDRVDIPEELPKFGSFCESDSNYFIVTGQDNTEKVEGKEVLRVSKYDKNWNKIGDASLKYSPKSNTTTTVHSKQIFHYGACRTAVFKGHLIIRTAYLGANDHQYMLNYSLNINDMAFSKKYTGGYGSHSFNQLIGVRNSEIAFADRDDSFSNRAFDMSFFDYDDNDNYKLLFGHFMKFGGQNGDNYTGSELGDLIITPTSYLVAGCSIDQSKFDEAEAKSGYVPYNVFLATIKKDSVTLLETATGENNDLNPNLQWLTNNGNGSSYLGPQYGMYLIPVSDSKYMLIWTTVDKLTRETEDIACFGENTICYAFFDNNGEKLTKTYTYQEKDWSMGLSDCHPIYHNGNVVWYSWKDGVETFYQIPVSSPEKVNKTTHFYPHEWIGSNGDDISFEGNDKNVRNHIPYDFKKTDFVEWEKTENGYKCYRIEYHVDDRSNTRKVEVPVTETVTKNATCSEEGEKTYTATIVDTTPEYKETKTEVIPKSDKHDWNTPVVKWSDDHKTCTAERTCKIHSDVKETINLTVTKTIDTTATDWFCDKYTASGEFTDGVKVNDEATFYYTEPTYSWYIENKEYVCEASRRIINFGETNTRREKVLLTITKEYSNKPCDEENTCTYNGTGTFADGTPLNTAKANASKVVTIPAGSHAWDEGKVTEATCQKEGSILYTCTKCGRTKTETIAKKDHEFELVQETPATCTSQGKKEYQCKHCNEKKEEILEKTEHEWEDAPTIDKKATCTEDGEQSIHCKNCEERKDVSILPKTNHKNTEIRGAKDANCKEDGYTGDIYCKDCSSLLKKGEVIPKGNHNYKSSVTKEATCSEEGVMTYTCSGCGDSYTQPIDKKDHTAKTPVGVKESTCAEEGYSGDIYCKDCGTLMEKGHSIAKKDHDYEMSVTREASCKETGIQKYVCKNCGDSYEKDIPKTDHQHFEVRNKKEATCASVGYTGDKYCKDCDVLIEKGKEIPKTNQHQWSAYKVVEEATCIKEGAKERKCSLCQKTERISIPKKAHQSVVDAAVPASVGHTGLTEGSHCAVCGTVLKQQTVIPALVPQNPKGDEKDPTSVAGEEKKIVQIRNDADPKGATFQKLRLRLKKATKNSISLSWNRVSGASGYIVYGNMCNSGGKVYNFKELYKTSGSSFTHKKLSKGRYYKYLVVAYQIQGGTQKVLTTSKTVHIATTGGKVGNYKSIKLNKSRVTIKKGKTFKIKAKEVPASKKMKVKRHRRVAYESSNSKVATVTGSGKIKGIKKGKCTIYIYSQSGLYRTVSVTVK